MERIRRKYLHSWSRVCGHVFQSCIPKLHSARHVAHVDFGIKLFFLGPPDNFYAQTV
jgi:hypothetical protein